MMIDTQWVSDDFFLLVGFVAACEDEGMELVFEIHLQRPVTSGGEFWHATKAKHNGAQRCLQQRRVSCLGMKGCGAIL
ncbi:MAG: hypothetical protein FWF31_07565 [Desulfobulbus sp.]|nr:hypothetical protein [Desulfobulbus sp.]